MAKSGKTMQLSIPDMDEFKGQLAAIGRAWGRRVSTPKRGVNYSKIIRMLVQAEYDRVGTEGARGENAKS